jgi:hypothetical protein
LAAILIIKLKKKQLPTTTMDIVKTGAVCIPKSETASKHF